MTQLEAARQGLITKEMEAVARVELREPSFVRDETARGRAVIPANIHHHALTQHTVIGRMFKTKVNANIGTSKDWAELSIERQKLDIAVKFGTDTLMDLSTGGDLDSVRKDLLGLCKVPLGTVPIYQAVAEREGDFLALTGDDLFRVIRRQAEQGVDYMTLHCGVTRKVLPHLGGRLTGIVSRGGSMHAAWLIKHGKENPLYERFDEILDIARAHDVTLSLGDGLRPGCLHDCSDEAQFTELRTLGELTLRAWEKGVQVMIEGPGHVPIHEIERNMKMEQEICHDAPFYVLGPLVTDVAPGYDHLTGAMGGLIAAYHGAAMLCYVTPKEHVGLPNVEDVKAGVIAFKIAAHAADVGRGMPGAREWDDELSKARKALLWNRQFELAIDPETARRHFLEHPPTTGSGACSMCADFCSMKTMNEVMDYRTLEARTL